MGDQARLARLGPVVGLLVVVAGLALAAGWRWTQPARAEVPLAARALELHDAWRRGELRLAPGPPSVAALRSWLRQREIPLRGGGHLAIRGEPPRLDLPVQGAAMVDVDGHPGIAIGLGDDRRPRLLLVLDASAATLLGRYRQRLIEEWNDYRFAGDGGRVAVWVRGHNLYALVGDLDFDAVRRALPPPRAGEATRSRIRPPELHFRPPGPAVPAAPPAPVGTAGPGVP